MELLNNIPAKDRESKLNFEENSNNQTIKTLGVIWNPMSDQFSFSIAQLQNDENVQTKRSVLSHIAKLFDPLGLLGPVILIAKMLMQDLWRLQLEWDEPLPQTELETWNRFVSELLTINTIKIDRHVMTNEKSICDIIGYCDASQKAYGACIYLCDFNDDGCHYKRLLCSKS